MSPIGKVFIVLNLVLAGVFVGFAGTYLQQATDWKQKHDDVQSEADQAKTDFEASLAASNSEKEELKRKLNVAVQAQARADSDVQALTQENERLGKQLSAIQGDQEAMKSSLGSIQSSIEQSSQLAKDSNERALAAVKERDDAVRAQQTAEANLADANNKIATLEGSVTDRDGQIAALEASRREQDILLAIVRRKAPGLLANAQPDLSGTVHHVGAAGRLITVTVTGNDGGAEIAPGYRFAIFNGDTYKGEAQITSVDGNNAFCNVVAASGPPIQVGDSATTNTY